LLNYNSFVLTIPSLQKINGMKKYLLPVVLVAILGLGCSKSQMKQDGSVNQSSTANARLVNALTLKITSSSIQGIDFGTLDPGSSSSTKQIHGDIRAISLKFTTDGKAIQTAAFVSLSTAQGSISTGNSSPCNEDPFPSATQSPGSYTCTQAATAYQIRLIETTPGNYGLAVIAN
jgi:hypothetical protein